MKGLIKKLVGVATIGSALIFGNPDRAYAPELPLEFSQKHFDVSLQYFEKKKWKEAEMNKYSKFIGKSALDKWIQDAIDKIHPHKLVDLDYVLATMKQESRFNPRAVSGVGASGLMQSMPATWEWIKKDGSFYKDRFNPDKNLEVGIKVLDSYARFCEKNYPDWNHLKKEDKIKLVSAAYNGGNGRLQKRGWDVDRMPSETRAYVPKILEYYNQFNLDVNSFEVSSHRNGEINQFTSHKNL